MADQSYDSSESGILQRLTAVEVELRSMKELNTIQHQEVGNKIDAIVASVRELSSTLTKGADSHEGRIRVLESLGNKGLAIIGICGIVLGSLLGVIFGWIPNPFHGHK